MRKLKKLMEAAHIINEKQKLLRKPIFETHRFSSKNIDWVRLASLTVIYKVDGTLHKSYKRWRKSLST